MQKVKLDAKQRLLVLAVVAAAVVALFLVFNLWEVNWDYALPRRAKKIAAIGLTGAGIALSSLLFQTITNNRILTPSVMGLDSLYLFIQTALVFFLSSNLKSTTDVYRDFFLSCFIMVAFSLLLFRLLFTKENQNIFTLILAGMILGSLFGSLATFMQVLMDPNEFEIVQGSMFASFNNVNTTLLLVSAIIIIGCFLYCFSQSSVLDVMSLGREHAVSLGIPFRQKTLVFLVIVAVLVAVSTALVGPVTFLGILVVNLARELLKTYRHNVLAIGSTLLAIIFLVGGQFLVEQVFQWNTTISVIINFVGGIYFIGLLLKERERL